MAPSMAATLMVCLVAFTLLFHHLLKMRITLERQRDETARLRELALDEE